MALAPKSFALDQSQIKWEFSFTQLKSISTRVSASQSPARPHDPTLDEESSQVTPKARACSIPQVLECPPAPRKKRAVGKRRIARATAFFNPPDLELFFTHDKRHCRKQLMP
ncbi:hypothetical protein O6H91_22G057800 [Diphasiastrum complanatum]|uniref:Uncharacterized protein n=1 Tax=Diphasiastrum complanatum TaxID=34168 RepID=A0ACC2AG31_DIPCM|nr:hypothetical protein O6H91_22G057800 [Diphasiastrum complanatum]